MLVWFRPAHPAAPPPPTNASGDLPNGNPAMLPLPVPKKPLKAPAEHAPATTLPGQQQAGEPHAAQPKPPQPAAHPPAPQAAPVPAPVAQEPSP
jgi:pyruvate dehydrogenase E2 component (dihydrolipoamide acetyltransferase)